MSLWRSLRVRLTAAFLALATCAVGIAAFATVRLVQESSLGSLDTALLEEATTLATLVDVPHERLIAMVRELGSESDLGPGKFVLVVAASGDVLASAGRMPPGMAKRRPMPFTAAQIATLGEDAATFRVAWAPAKAGDTVAVGIRAAREIRVVRRAQWAVSLLAAFLLGVLGVGAWVITGRSTRELDRLSHEVATIEAGSLERRLSIRRTSEVDRLVTVLNRVLERLERSMTQMRRFTADAAHELRTPLAAIRARLEVALCRDGSAVPRDVVVEVLEQTERLHRLAEDLLMLARVEGGAVQADTMRAVDLSQLAAEVVSSMAPVAEEQGRAFGSSVAPGVVVRGSEPLLKRLLLNLVDNAFRHTPPSGRVDVELGADGSHAVIEVRDHGPGLDPSVLPHAFERFRHGAGNGNGLGLALVREIVEQHGGRVALEPAPSGGTRARVVLALGIPGTPPADPTPGRALA